MGFIKAITDSVGGTFADQWKEFYGPQSNIPATAGLFKAVANSTNNDRGQNTKGSENIISNGSKIMVPEGTALITMQDGGVTGLIAEPGAYIFSSEDINSQSFFGGNGIISSTISQSWDRFKFGGQPGSQQLAFYVNLKEIPNNKFGTQNEVYWDDVFLGTQVGAIARGSYSIKIVDPILFIKQFVPTSFLSSDASVFDFADMNNDAANQLFNEVVGSLSSAFGKYSVENKGSRMNQIQSDQIGLGKALSSAVEENFSWKSTRGLEISTVALQSIEYDKVTKELITEVQRADALSGTRGNSYMQQSVARGIEAAGSTSGGTGMAFMGMGANVAGGIMNGMQQPATPNLYQQSMQEQSPNVEQTTQNIDPYAKLTEMKKLLDAGVITQEDFDKVKAQVLGI